MWSKEQLCYEVVYHAEWFITPLCDFSLNSTVAVSLYINLRFLLITNLMWHY